MDLCKARSTAVTYFSVWQRVLSQVVREVSEAPSLA